jgi:hypothetical protein|tara:strand:+ start:17 stop:793 length:777 start_codon:yes stop_codon:yes gene_type:complete
MGDFFGKKSKRRQTAAMNDMNAMIQGQVDEFKGKQQTAQEVADQSRADYANFEFTNPFAGAQNVYAGAQNMYEGMENRFEDMTVDMRAADFQTQQGQQQRANIMQSLKGAAGGSGVAGLAQAMANQGQLQSQQIAASIGQQERQNKMLAAQEGSRIDMTQRGAGMQLQQMQMAGADKQQQMIMQGAADVQAAEAGQQATLLGMDYAALAGANQAYQGSLANQMSAMGMKADMYGSQSQNNMFSQLTDAAAAVSGYFPG